MVLYAKSPGGSSRPHSDINDQSCGEHMKKPSVRDMLIGAGIASILNDGGDEPKTTRSKRGCLGCFGLLVILGLVGYGLEKLGCIPDRDDEEETVTTRNETAEPRDKDGRLIAEKMAVLEKKMAEYWRKTNVERNSMTRQ